jgi:hypothetical protein
MVALAIGQEEIVRHVATWAAPRPDRCGIDSTAPARFATSCRLPLVRVSLVPENSAARTMIIERLIPQVRRAAL